MTVSDAIFRAIIDAGTDCVFTLAGGLAMHLNDSALRSGIRVVTHHHELCCTIAADAYARQSGKLGVAMLTGGPGLPWGIGGVVGAWQDSIPLLVLVGQAKRSSTIAGTGLACRQVGTFEVDAIPMAQSVTKYAATIDSVEFMAGTIRHAIREATSGRPGPVVVEVPLDVQGATIA